MRLELDSHNSQDNCAKFILRGGLTSFSPHIYYTVWLQGIIWAATRSDQFIQLSRELLEQTEKAISYNIAALLSQLLADGANAWHYHAGSGGAAMALVAMAYSHAEVSEQVVATIDKCKPPGDRSIIFFSLLPLLSTVEKLLLDSFKFQLFTTRILKKNPDARQPDMYCKMLIREARWTH